MHRPFFSIVVPTKNRSQLIQGTINSILKQSYEDFELIISDNDDTDSTRRVVEGYTDSRIRYCRTGGLTMPDNWEAGSLHATGRYLILFEDKIALKRHALSRLFDIIQKEDPDSIAWDYDVFYDLPRLYLFNRSCNGEYHVSQRHKILTELVRCNFDYFNCYGPVGAKSCVRMDLVHAVRGRNKRLCLPVSPDYTMAYQLMCVSDKFIHLNEALSVVRYKNFNDSYGNGNSVFLKTALGQQFFKELNLANRELYENVPVKTYTLLGSMLCDFFGLKSVYVDELRDYFLDIPSFFVEVYDETIRRERMRVDVREEFAAWRKAFEEQPAAVQSEIRQRLFKIRLKRLKYRLSVLCEKSSAFYSIRERIVNKVFFGHGVQFEDLGQCLDSI